MKPTLEYTIHTIASIGHVKWRPQRKYHIASCALVVDCSINIWDIRRPYIPFAAFNEHKDIASGVAWRGDPHVFLSTSRVNTTENFNNHCFNYNCFLRMQHYINTHLKTQVDRQAKQIHRECR